MNARPILIMAGGTGGHVFPALAVARDIQQSGVPVLWLGTRQGMEARLVPAAGLPVAWIHVSGLRGKGVLQRLAAPFMLSLALLQALWVMLRVRPRAVLGMGGFVAGPGGVMAWLTRRPLLIHEQNSVAGLTNRWLAPLADQVMEAFPGSLPAKFNPRHTGNPVRQEIAALPEPGVRLAGREDNMKLLILGGSLGAQALNQTLPAALALLAGERRPQVLHQAGDRLLDECRNAYQSAGIDAEVRAFIDDMAAAYAWADLVVCRAGALTIAELTAAGLGAVLVPYPYAVDDHQTGNARYLESAGAAMLIPQQQLSPGTLAETLQGLAENPGQRLAMAVAARALAQPDAAREVADCCLRAAGEAV